MALKLIFFAVCAAGEVVEPQFPISYVIHTAEGPMARVLVAPGEACPELQGLRSGRGAVRVRAVGDMTMPHRFPVKVCEAQLALDADVSGLVFGRRLPKISREVKNMVLVGDTGLRVKPKNDGTCLRPGAKKLYGVKQCRVEDLMAFNASLVSGSFQSLKDWPLKQQMERAAKEEPDLVIHVGDYMYRQAPCPENQPCTGINNPFKPRMPGAWGDNWDGWYADFFAPSLDLLSQAPWIVLRGNHERCDRGGAGYFLFLDPRPYPAVRGGDFCEDYTEPYAVPFVNQQFLVLDTALIDDVESDDVCPGVIEQVQIFPSNRLEDPKQRMSKDQILKQVDIYAGQFKQIEDMKSEKTNIFLSHHPLFGLKCNQGRYESVEWTLQQALSKTTLDGIAATIHGHVHWFQGLELEGLPPHFVVGNGGTKLRSYEGLEQGGTGRELVLSEQKVTISRAFSKSAFGFSQLKRSAGAYTLLALERGAESMWNTSFAGAGRSLSEAIHI